VAKKREKSSSVEVETCAYCGAELSKAKENRALVCPDCGRDGCFECIPGGNAYLCPECEEKADGSEDQH
jgi:predicted RNA-binding Zn-ribbon protein involved in translation (DUF1610 family)